MAMTTKGSLYDMITMLQTKARRLRLPMNPDRNRFSSPSGPFSAKILEFSKQLQLYLLIKTQNN